MGKQYRSWAGLAVSTGFLPEVPWAPERCASITRWAHQVWNLDYLGAPYRWALPCSEDCESRAKVRLCLGGCGIGAWGASWRKGNMNQALKDE